MDTNYDKSVFRRIKEINFKEVSVPMQRNGYFYTYFYKESDVSLGESVRQVIVRQASVRQVIVRQASVRQVIVRQASVRQAIVRQASVRQAIVYARWVHQNGEQKTPSAVYSNKHEKLHISNPENFSEDSRMVVWFRISNKYGKFHPELEIILLLTAHCSLLTAHSHHH